MTRLGRTLFTAAVAMIAATTAGCGATEDVQPVASFPAAFSGAGTYTVPADPSVAFPVAEVSIATSNGVVDLYYELPESFYADSPGVYLTGTVQADGTAKLSGPAGTSSCALSATSLQCKEDLTGMRFNVAEAMDALPASAADARAVFAFFSDPIGVLHVPLDAADTGKSASAASNDHD
jgi:hypothetical protein